MAADGPGKYKGSKRRTAKPYDRPQGSIFRRVTDSVTGLFGSLSGWLGADDDGTEEAPAAASAAASSAPPGESFIFAQPPTTHRKPYRPIYPEEGEDIGEGPSSVSSSAQVSSAAAAAPTSGSGINLGAASSSSGTTSMASTPLTRGLLGTTSTSLGHPLPLISSTPYDQPLRTRPLMRPTPTSIDSGTESPGTDFIMPPRRVGLDDETFTSLRMPIISEANKTPSPSSANAVIPSLEKMSSSPVNALPSLEETQRKRIREIDTDHNSSLGGDSISNRSLFSETGSRASLPQMPGASKKPRFNVSAFSSSSLMGDRSLLSDSTTRPSPFYPWRTAYGGASANKRNRYQNRLQPNRAQIKPKPPPSDSTAEDGGLSQAARRILDCLNNMSTPISDAKRIPTPSPGQRGSFLDSSYTATYYKHRPPSRNSGPPVTKLLTPTKAVVQPNLSKLIGGSSGEGSSSSSTVAETSSAVSTPVKSTQDTLAVSTSHKNAAPATKPQEDPPPSTKPSQEASSLQKQQQEQTSNVQKLSATSASKPAVTKVLSKSTTDTSKISFKTTTESSSAQPLFRFGESNKSTESVSSEKPLFRFGNRDSASNVNTDDSSAALAITSRPSIHSSESPPAAITKGGGGKLKTKISDTGRASRRDEDDDETPVPVLPAVSLTMSSLPKINFTATQTNAVFASSQSLTTTGFTFSAPQAFSEPPKAALNSCDSAIVSNELEFTFSTPQNLLNDAPKVNHTSGAPMFNSVSTSFQPKLKTSVSKSKLNATPLKKGSILDVLKTNKVNTSLNEETSKSSEFSVTNTNSLAAFMKKGDEWSCDTCMVTNKIASEKCVACETPKPGASTKQAAKISSNLTPTAPVVTNSLTAFMKKGDEWICDTCMLTNKSSVDKCAACETLKPGSTAKTSVTSSLPLSSSSSSFSAPSTFNAPVGFNFQKSSSEWECSECLVRNKDSAETCVCCQSAKPGTKTQQSSSVFSSGLSSNNSLASNTDWKCETCLVQNTKDIKKCKECDTAKPSAVIGSQVITGNFKFGVGNTSANNSSSGGFKFGVSNSSVTEAVSSTGFSFGVNNTSVNKDSITTSTTTTTGFSFGIKPAEGENSGTTGFKLGVNSTESKTEEREPENGGGFSFGIPQKTTKEKTEVLSKTETSFSNADSNKTEDKADSVPKPAFSFGSATGGFTFLGNPNGKKDNTEKTAKEENSSGGTENKKESEKPAFAFSFGNKPTENDVTSQKTPFSFSNTSKDTSNTMVNSSETFSFGTPKGDEKLKTSAPTFFGAKPTESPSSLTFGGNVVPKANAAAAPTTNTTFAFSSAAATTKETKSPFGGKRDSSGCDEPARKLPFGTSNTTNSGLGNSTTSLFTFGSNNSKSGPGFGATPASNPPAFGSPAPVVSAANPTPSFFSNSTAPATTPAFGSSAPTPMFGQGFGVPNNNNNNPSFAFGQPAEKKASTGFDFGQATPNSSTPSFNFGTSEPAGAPSLFQFGQSQPNNTNTGGSPVFQFGSGPTATPTPAFGAGGDNIFSPAGARSAGGQPDRRIKKKAVRRIPK